jgi:hypothetical protein
MFTTSKRISKRGILNIACSNAMQQNTSQRSSECRESTSAKVRSHAATFAKVLAGRKQPVRGPGKTRSAIFAQLCNEDSALANNACRVPLANRDGSPVDQVSTGRRIYKKTARLRKKSRRAVKLNFTALWNVLKQARRTQFPCECMRPQQAGMR